MDIIYEDMFWKGHTYSDTPTQCVEARVFFSEWNYRAAWGHARVKTIEVDSQKTSYYDSMGHQMSKQD